MTWLKFAPMSDEERREALDRILEPQRKRDAERPRTGHGASRDRSRPEAATSRLSERSR